MIIYTQDFSEYGPRIWKYKEAVGYFFLVKSEIVCGCLDYSTDWIHRIEFDQSKRLLVGGGRRLWIGIFFGRGATARATN